MAIPIEQITAPGKWEYDLAMEELEAELKNPAPLYNNNNPEDKSKENCRPKVNFYYISPHTKKK